jgi:GT2 family glycosyltransferase
VTPPPLIRVSERDDLRKRAREIALADAPAPIVSIVVPIVNGIRLTLECLLSIVRHTDGAAFEVIVVDNGSTDESQDILSTIPNLRYARQDGNLGFGPGCNAGAALASGRYIVFLNNDAQVQAGWLTAMLEIFNGADDVGAVGPKVLFPDGRLQDAGSAINPDCTSTLIGVFDDPNAPRFNYRREVPYLSAVCLMVEADRFRADGGFDPAFAPAYCEDVDLCLRLRRDGLRVVYQPAAVVVHHLSATSSALSASFKMAAVTSHQQTLAVRHQAQVDALSRPRVIAFYLPQFHPIPENDVWWGKGFTEWRNVTRARPNFPGHYQPRFPADLGFYDLRLRETYQHQVALAERYGVDAFCFYYYWFDGKRLLERPLERLLEDSSISFPFCICWANENWTRRWDGMDHEILMAQAHRTEDDRAVIADVIRYVQHPSYIRVNGRPLILVYSATRFPDIRATLQTWRAECRAGGIGEIYVAMVESFDLTNQKTTPVELGFDAAVEFPPHNAGLFAMPGRVANSTFRGQVFSYEHTAVHYLSKPLPGYTCFRTVMPGWDNSPRRLDDAVVFAGSTPGAYQAWLEGALRQAREQLVGDEQLVFINAWNEWAEGAYLEPDLGWGHGYLEATRNARDNVRLGLR